MQRKRVYRSLKIPHGHIKSASFPVMPNISIAISHSTVGRAVELAKTRHENVLTGDLLSH